MDDITLKIDITDNLFSQFAEQLKIDPIGNVLTLNPKDGDGNIKIYKLPNSLELFHFRFTLNRVIIF